MDIKVNLSKDECKMIKNLLKNAALNTKDYTWQGRFRELKDLFSKIISEHEKNLQSRRGY